MGGLTLFPIRIAQGILAFAILILLAYVVSHWPGPSPADVNFLLFVSAWTILATAYLTIFPSRYPEAAHKYAVLGVEVLTCLFWFAGWVAVAVLLGDIGVKGWRPGQVGAVADVFAAIEWILFSGTSIMAVRHVMDTRHRIGKANTAMRVDTRV